MACPTSIPEGMCSDHNVEPLLQNLRDYIGLHALVRNENGDIVDLSLVWWNDAYEGIRIHPPVLGQSMMATYFEPDGVIEIVKQVLEQGIVKQIFSIGENAGDRYRAPDIVIAAEPFANHPLLIAMLLMPLLASILITEFLTMRNEVRQLRHRGTECPERESNPQEVAFRGV